MNLVTPPPPRTASLLILATLGAALVAPPGAAMAGAERDGGAGPQPATVPDRAAVAALMSGTDQTDPAEIVAECMSREMAQDGIPGGAIAVIQDGELAYAAGFGVKHRDEGGPVDADTQFRIGSTTKMFTAAGLLKLVDSGRIDLDAPITRYIPDFRMAIDGEAESITVRHLLEHTSSFPDNSALTEEDLYGPTDRGALGRWVAAQTNTRLHAWPGAFHNYTSAGYMLAGHVIERVSGMSYQEFMRREVFDPAGMDDSTLLTSEVRARGNWAYGHWRDYFNGGRLTIFPIDGHDNWARHPTGYVHSTVKDLVLWADLLMTGGGEVISADAAAAMQEPHAFRHEGPYQHYGYGVISDRYASLAVKHHAGSQWGWTTAYVWVPEHRFAVATLSNHYYSLASSAYCAIEAYLQPEPGPSIPCLQDPDSWREFAGSYEGRGNRGSTMDEEVVWTDGQLSMTITYESGTVVETPLTQTCNDYRRYSPTTFWADSNGDGGKDVTVTFIRDPRDEGVMWLRNRFFVARRGADEAPTPTSSAPTPDATAPATPTAMPPPDVSVFLPLAFAGR